MSHQAARSFLLYQFKVYSLVGAILWLWACSETSPSLSLVPPEASENEAVSYSVLVKFKDATAVTDGRAAQRLRAAGLIRPQQLGLVPGLTRSSLRQGQDLQQTLADMEKQANIAYAEPDYAVWPLAIPNDARFSQLDGLNNIGQNGGIIDADIDAPEAWDLQTGNDVVIAVIDSGVDYRHPDLKDNIWVNVNEIPDNGIDDDGNGFIDDVHGWNFVNNSNDPMDQRDHGTHVAGTLAAVGNNQTGITGVNWQAKIMPLKFIDNEGVGSVSKAIAALEYAVANGARISNNSWGGGKFSQAMHDALSAANAAGHVFVVGAGNDAKDNDRFPHYPSSYDLNNVIAVVATDNTDQLAAFSNYGVRATDLAAPGTEILSTARNNRYRVLSGSSIAAPYVSGVTSLILSQNPHLTVSDIRSILLTAVDKQDSLIGKVASGGRINAFKAVSTVPINSSIVLVNPIELSPKNLELAVGASRAFTASGGLTPFTWTVDNPNVGKINPNTGIFIGQSQGTVQIIASDANGDSASVAVVVKAEAAALSLSPAGTQVLGVNEQLSYTVQGGQAPYQWSSSNTSVANIDTSGVATETAMLSANALGTARIGVVDANGAYLVVKVKVIDPAVSLLAITPSQVTLTVNETATLTASGGGPTYSWASSNANVASVGATTGIVTGVSVGAATIIVSSNGITDPNTANVTVQAATSNPPPSPGPSPGPITVTSPASTVSVGQTLQFTATGGTPPYTWTVTNNLISSINANGLLSIPATIPFGGQMNVIATDVNNVVGRSGAIAVTAAAGTPQPTPPGGTPLPPGTTPPGTTPTPGPAPTPTPAPTPAPAPVAGGGGGGGMGGGGMGGGGMGGGM